VSVGAIRQGEGRFQPIVGMQNNGLGVSLAVSFFSSASAVPGAFFSHWQNLAGAGLANWWRKR